MLQALNILENFDLKSMGYNAPRYIHTVYQAMSLAYADRDFYYGDIYFPPDEPVLGLLSKDYAKERAKLINPDHNDPTMQPGDPYPYPGAARIRSRDLLRKLAADSRNRAHRERRATPQPSTTVSFYAGTTSIEAADAEGWVVSVTPSGGWIPAVIAGHTGVGLSQRAQSFVTDPAENPFNVIEPGKRPRVTLTPTLAMKDGAPWLAFSVQGGDTQDQNLLQFFLDVVEFGMTPQEATEAPNINSFQMHKLVRRARVRARPHARSTPPTPPCGPRRAATMGYTLQLRRPHVGPDQRHHGSIAPTARSGAGRAITARTTGIAW